MIRVATALLALLCASSVAAQTVAITGGRAIPMDGSGVLARGTVIVRDGRIVAVGHDVATPRGAAVLAASGNIVTPGLVASGPDLRLNEVTEVGATREPPTT